MVGALLTVSIPDLKPNSQDTSAFYLKNIYQLFGNTNISHPSIPSFLTAEPPAFSPPKYAIWANSLWFLSLTLSLSCAMRAMMNRSWAVQYFETTRLPHYLPPKRARIRALFTKGYPGPYTLWGTNNGDGFLHVSVLLFITGGLIYFFNINHTTFYAVVWWVGYLAMAYTYETVEVFFVPHNLFHTPLSQLALRIYLAISYAVFQVCSCIPPLHGLSVNIRRRYYDLSNCYREGILRGKQKTADGITSKPSSKIDTLILERILLTLDDDLVLENFFDAIPGFCKSKLSVMPLSVRVRTKLRPALDGFLDYTFSSGLISESVRASRLITCLDAAHAALEPGMVSQILGDLINGRWNDALECIEIGHALRLWDHRRDHDLDVRRIMVCIIARAQRRDDRWTMLVKEAFGVPDGAIQESLAHGDSVLLAILIHISRQPNSSGFFTSGILSSLSKFDICNTLPGLQDDFRTLWNEIAQEARNQGSSSIPAQILREIRHLYISLNRSTNAAPTAFSASTDRLDSILDQPSLHPLGDIPGHQQSLTIYTPGTGSLIVPSFTQLNQSPAALPRHSSVESDHNRDCNTAKSTASQIIEKANIVVEPSDYKPHPSHTQGFTSPPLAPDSAHIDRVSGPSVTKSIGTAITWDPDLLVPSEASHSHDLGQFAPPAAEIAATKFVWSDALAPRMHTNESGETSQAPVAPLISQHPDSFPATIMSSTRPDPVGDPDALRDTTSTATLSYPPQGNKQQDTVTPCTPTDISEIPSAVDPIPRSIPASPAIVFSDSLPPNLLLACSSGMTTAELPSFAESAPIQPDIPNAFRSPSSCPTTANSYENHDLNPPIPMTLLYSDQMAQSAHDIVAATLRLEDQAYHDLDKL